MAIDTDTMKGVRVDLRELKAAAAAIRKAPRTRNPSDPWSGHALLAYNALHGGSDDMIVSVPLGDAFGMALAVPYDTIAVAVKHKGTARILRDAIILDDGTVLRFSSLADAANDMLSSLKAIAYVAAEAYDSVCMYTGAEYRDGAAMILPATSKDTSRPVLRGVYIDSGEWSATDCYRLHTATIAANPDVLSGEGGAIIPAKALGIIAAATKADGVRITAQGGRAYIFASRAGQVIRTVSVRIIDGQYPNVLKLYPDYTDATITCDGDALVAALSNATRHDSVAVLSNDAGALRVEIRAPKEAYPVAESTISADCLAFDPIGIHADYLRDAINAMPGTDVTLLMGGALRPVIIEPADHSEPYGARALVMPIRI